MSVIPDPGSVPSWVCLGKLLLSFPICVYVCVCVCVCVCVRAQSCLTLCDPWTITCQAPLSVEFSRQEYWSELPFPPPGDLPDPGIEPASPVVSCIGRQVLYLLSHRGSPMCREVILILVLQSWCKH